MRLLPQPLACRMGYSIALVAVALLVAASCGSQRGVVASPGGEGDEDLRGRTFLSTEVTTGGRPHDLVDGTQVRLAFTDDGRLLAGAGCNSMQGPVDLGGGTIAVDDLVVTEMGCDPALHEQDAWLADLLAGGPTWRLDGHELVVTSGQTTLVLLDREVADPDRSLTGTRWVVNTLVDGEVVSSQAGIDAAYLLFEEGSVTGSTGCNEIRGSATVSGSTIEFRQVTTTGRACEPELADVERHVLAVLDGDVRFEIEADQLRLDHPGGKGLVLGADETGADETGADETGADEPDANEPGADETVQDGAAGAGADETAPRRRG